MKVFVDKELFVLMLDDDIRTKRQVIDANKHKYSITAMCKVLGISRSTYYYQGKETVNYSEEAVEEVFQQNR